MNQNTLKKEISISGIGLHSGEKVSMKLKPADAGSGIVFIRTDLSGMPRTMASLRNVTSTARGTNIGNFQTVEHILSALYSLSVANVEIELDSSEPPSMDGSSIGFFNAIKNAGIKAQDVGLKVIKINEPVFAGGESKSIIALPSDRLKISFMIDYPFDFIGTQFYKFDHSPDGYQKDIAPARTYGFIKEIEALKEQGLAKGASMENAVAVGEEGYLNELRFKDELVRHKILDLIGDISLLGAEIKAHIICIRSGHELNFRLAKKIEEVG